MTERGSVSVSSSTSRIVYVGNNSLVTAYAVPFYFQLSSHLVVVVTTAAGIETTLAQGSGYTVTGAGNPAGGSIVTTAAWDNTHTVAIYREVPATQLTVYADNDAFPASSHEAALDKLTMLAQQAIRKAGSALRVTEASTPPAPAKSVPLSVAGLDGGGNTVFRTPEELVDFLPEWFTAAALPTMTGNPEGLLTNDGSTAYWTSYPTVRSLRITDATFPILELRTTTGPTDKKFVRWSADATGGCNIERVNDAYTAATRLIGWDASNNTTLGTGTLTVNGGISGVQGTIKGAADNSAWSIVAGSSSPGVSTAGAWLSLYGGTSASNPGALVFGCNTAATGVVTPGGNFGFGTTTPGARVHVAGGNVLLENNLALQWKDTVGAGLGLAAQNDNNFVFTGTNSSGAPRAIFSCFMRSNWSPFVFYGPLKIGANGANIYSVLKATVTHVIGTIAAGGFLELTSTVTGAIAGAMVHVGSGAPINLILRGYSDNGDMVSVMYFNPSAASVNAGTRTIDLFVTNII